MKTSPPVNELERSQSEAWAVHRALLIAQIIDPSLRNNPRFQLLRMDAYEDFHSLMTRQVNGR